MRFSKSYFKEYPPMEALVEKVLHGMSSVNRPQRTFVAGLLAVLMVFQGKANFRNLSRYCGMHEKRFSRWYRRTFDFVTFNRELLGTELPAGTERIAAIDASFLRKSGKHTEGLGWFYRGQSGRAEKGLEVSLVCVVDLRANTAYSLDARQTLDDDETTRVDSYADQIKRLSCQLKAMGIRHVAADAYYSKVKFIDAVCAEALDLIGKLRVDAHLLWPYSGSYAGKGRPRKYDSKADLHADLARFEPQGDQGDGVHAYSAVVWVKAFKRKVKLVLLRWEVAGKVGHALLYSTDLTLPAQQIIARYQARFQIEFLFRDSKQFTGLMDCQARSQEAIHTHLNAALTALNLIKLEDRRVQNTDRPVVISIASWRRRKCNENLMDRLFEQLGLNRSCEKVKQVYDEFRDYGAIAA